MKKITIYVLFLTFVISLVIHPVSASDDYWSKKLSDEIAVAEPNENGDKLIFIWREKVSDDAIEEMFVERHGYSILKYENDGIYKMLVVPEVTERVNTKYGKVA